MHIIIASIGRMKSGNERELLEKYINRVSKSGKSLGIADVQCIEIAESRASSDKLRIEEEAKNLLSAVPAPNHLVALDERGELISSKAFSKLIGQQISEGQGRMVFAIGGADGLGQNVIEKAARTLAFGAMTWPHQFARIMLAEQIYRATTILSGHPYHRN